MTTARSTARRPCAHRPAVSRCTGAREAPSGRPGPRSGRHDARWRTASRAGRRDRLRRDCPRADRVEIDADPVTRLRGIEELVDRFALVHHFLRPSGLRLRLLRAVCRSPLRASMPATPRDRFTGTGFRWFAHALTSSACQTGVARSLAIGSGKSSRRVHRFACVREVSSISAISASPARSSRFRAMYKILTQRKWGSVAGTTRPWHRRTSSGASRRLLTRSPAHEGKVGAVRLGSRVEHPFDQAVPRVFAVVASGHPPRSQCTDTEVPRWPQAQ